MRGAALSWLAPGLALAGAVLGAHACWVRVEKPTLATEGANALAVFVAVLAFAALCLRARRWLALPVAALGVAALAAAHAYDLYRPVRLYSPAEDVRVARIRVAEIGRAERDVLAWREGSLPADSMPCGVSGYNLHYAVGLPIGIPLRGSSYEMIRYSGPVGANRAAWERYGEGLAGALPPRRREAEANLAAYQAGLAAPPRPATEEARLWAVESAELAFVLLALNGLSISLAGLFRRRPRASRAVAAG